MSDIIKITIDGKVCTGHAGDTILTIARNNGIEIPTLCYHESVKLYGACGLCTVEVEGSGKLFRACATVAQDGNVVHTDTPRVIRSRKVALELLMSEHAGDCKGPCSLSCPAGTDCQRYIKLIAEGRYRDAVEFIKETNPLPASIGRVCPHPCESACRRENVEEPISIAYLKYFAADMDMASGDPYVPSVEASSGKTVAVIGGGPGGLSAAYFLTRKGHKVTIFESMPHLGGMLRYGIPEYRLPKAILDKEIQQILDLGVEAKTNVHIGRDITLDRLKADYDAVIVAIGAWKSSPSRCKGEELEGVFGGIDFLRAVYTGQKPEIGSRVAVIGGGNTAMDACRVAVRAGAKEVYVIYRRGRDEMPAEDIEVTEAMEEGVSFKFLRSPVEIIGKDGRVCAIKTQVMALGEPDKSGRPSTVPVEGEFETIELDSVISAVGQQTDTAGLESLEISSRGAVLTDKHTYRTSQEGVFAIGDVTKRGAIAIAAIGHAHSAACVVDAYLNGLDAAYSEPIENTNQDSFWWGAVNDKANVRPFLSVMDVSPEMFEDKEKAARAVMPHLSATERRDNFRQVNLGFSPEQAQAEAKRCLECGCHDYGDCKLIRYAQAYPVQPERIAGQMNKREKERRLVAIERNQNKCILCGLCVRTCTEVVGKGILGLVGRGFSTVIRPEFNKAETIAQCADCLKCAQLCPTGALKILDK